MSNPLNVVIAGGYGHKSAGDDAPLIVLTEALREEYPDREFNFTVISRHEDAALFKRCGVGWVPNLEYRTREESAGRWFRGMNPLESCEPLERAEETIARADVLVIGAGNMLIDLAFKLFRGPIPLIAVYCFLAELHDVPVVLFGMNVGPFRTRLAPLLCGWIARTARAVACRDPESVATLRQLAKGRADVRLVPDPVLGLRPAGDEAIAALWETEGIPPRSERSRLAIALRGLGFAGIPHPWPVLVDALNDLAKDFELLFIPQCTYPDCDDRVEAGEVMKYIKWGACYSIQGEYPPDVLMRAYESCAAALTVRLHGTVFAAMADLPTVALEYLPKVRAFMESIGRREWCLPLDELRPAYLTNSVRTVGRLWRSGVPEICQHQGSDTRRQHAKLILEAAEDRP